MRSNIAYSLAEKASGNNLVYSRAEIEEKQMVVPELHIFEFQQCYTLRGNIGIYLSITIKSQRNILGRALELRKQYSLDYYDTAEADGVYYVRYVFPNPLKKDTVGNKAELLIYLFGGDSEHIWGFPIDQSNDTPNKTLSFQHLDAIEKKVFPRDTMTGVNKAEYSKVNKLSIQDVCGKLGISEDNTDHILNIHYVFGSVFETVLNSLGDSESAFTFFNAGYDCKFIASEKAEKTYKGDGVIIENDYLIRRRDGYESQGKEGDMRKITDFHIAVHSRYNTPDGVGYVVSLLNSKGDRADKIDYLNTSNKNKLSEFFLKRGNFHFYGTDRDVAVIHALISSQNVPEVKTTFGFGWTIDGKYCLFSNGIYDRKDKIFYESSSDTAVLYLPGGNGILPVDQQGRPILKGARSTIPTYHTGKSLVSADKLVDSLSAMWKDDTGMQVFLVACGILGSGLVGLQKEVPLYFVRGITESGKTTLSRIVHAMCGFTGDAHTMGGTAFPFLVTLSLVNNLPVFFSEARNNARAIEDKVGYLRSLFDRTAVPRGRADMTVMEYPLNAIAYIEGQEMMQDPATRSRFIQLNPKKENQIISTNFEEKIGALMGQCEYFMESYYELADIRQFDKYKAEFNELFAHHYSGRLLSNMRVLYASAMIYAPQLQSQIISTIEGLFDIQMTDKQENGSSMDIIKSVSAMLQRDEVFMYMCEDGFVIGWQSIVEYMTKYRHEVSLSPSSYREDLDGLGYTVDYYEVKTGVGNEMLIEGPKFFYKNLDKKLQCNPQVYAGYKAFNGITRLPI